MKIIDLRAQSEYNSGHIPGSLRLNPESLRGSVQGMPSCLLPEAMLAEHFSLMGIQPDDFIVLVSTNKVRDATLVGMACERLKHSRYAVLRGGFPKWQVEKRPVDTILSSVKPSQYPVPDRPDTFTVTAKEVLDGNRQAGDHHFRHPSSGLLHRRETGRGQRWAHPGRDQSTLLRGCGKDRCLQRIQTSG